MTPSEFESLLDTSRAAFFQRYHDRLISFSNVHEKGLEVLCRAGNWTGVDLITPLLEALAGVQHTADTLDLEEQENWRAVLTRCLYSPNHRMGEVIKSEPGPYCHRMMMDWMRAVEMQPAWEEGVNVQALKEIYTPSPSTHPGLLELLEIAVMQGPMRSASKMSYWRVPWAASALQQQRLHVFEALDPDANLLAEVLSTTRPVRDPDLHREHPFNRKAYLYNSDWADLKPWNQYAQELAKDPTNIRILSWLWLEWLHDPLIHVGTHKLAQRLGVDLSTHYSDGSCWVSAVATASVLDALLPDHDPMLPTQRWEQRLETFVSFGPACMEWRKKNNETWRDKWPEERPWLLDYLYQRWSQWTAKEQTLALDAWKIQALTGWGPHGVSTSLNEVSFTNTKAGWIAGELGDVMQWAANDRGNKPSPAGWRHPILLPKVPVNSWVHPDGSEESFAAGYFKTALHAPIDSMRIAVSSPWLGVPAITLEEEALRLLFTFGHAPMAKDLVRLSNATENMGERLGQLLRDILDNVGYPNCDVMVDASATTMLRAWLHRESMLPNAAWEGFAPHAQGIAGALLDRNRLPLMLLFEWAEQTATPASALFVSHAILRLMKDTWTMGQSNTIEHVDVRAADALAKIWTVLEGSKTTLPEGLDETLWRQALFNWPGLKMALVNWRQRSLQRDLPAAQGPAETKPRL